MSNLFNLTAMHLWEKGEDGEEIARDLAEALKNIIIEGKGKDIDLGTEFVRLLTDQKDYISTDDADAMARFADGDESKFDQMIERLEVANHKKVV